MTSSVVGLRRNSGVLPKVKLVTKRGRGHCWMVRCLSTAAFWILLKPLHLRSTLSISMRCTENFSAYSQHWSTEWAQFFSMTTPDRMLYTQHFKRWTNWATKFWLICHVQLTSCQPAGGRKCFPRVHQIPKHGFLCYGNKQTYFLLEKCWL